MVRLLTGKKIQVNFLIWAWLTCLTAASLTFEERLQALETNNVEIRHALAVKSERLEALENEVKQLKSTVIKLSRKRETSNKARNKREAFGKSPITINSHPIRTNVIQRTCHETRLADPSLPSGILWIDPDGQGVGDEPIRAYCDMETGTTSILHDSESPTDVGHCADPGCCQKAVNYSSVSERQMFTLMDLSNECQQSIRYDCNNSPFETNGVANSWWNDRNGIRRYFWAGNSANVHTCQCGIDRNCVDSTKKCNCDSSSQIQVGLSDNGVITNKNMLPVTRLSFGRVFNKSSGVYTLGRLVCSGKVAVKGMPSSCADLWRIGHTLNGLYFIKGTTMVESVYCNFSKRIHESGFQHRLGYVDVKSFPVYFYVKKNRSFDKKNTPIPFDVEQVNIGQAMNLASGIFTAPRTGVYMFTFSALARLTSYRSMNVFGVFLMLNGHIMGKSHLRHKGGDYDYPPVSFQSVFQMRAGDRVWVEIRDMENTNLYDNETHNTLFTGQLLQEDISQLLALV